MHWPGDVFFGRFLLISLLVFYLWAAIKGWLLNRRGVRVHKQTASIGIMGFLNRFVPTIRSYEIVACAWPLKWHLFPALLRTPLLDFLPLKIFGVILWLIALSLYAWAQASMGTAWRIGTSTDATLVTRGIFHWSRHPIYVGFLLMAWGTVGIYTQPSFILLAVVSTGLLQHQITQEEIFLNRHFGAAYRDYCQRTSRYFTI
jgi:protein-S-isoprenylcysteine O-methyltransferase Ste14